MVTIYKKDSKGKLRFLTISTEGSKVIQESGLLDGKATTNISNCEGKNIGKANETTPEQQAISEAEAKIVAKLKEGYYKTKEEAEVDTLILPMLAKDFKDQEKNIKYPCFIQRKYDGIRMLAIKNKGKVTLISRKNREIVTLNHIILQLESTNIPDGIYDGEAYNIDIGSFQNQVQAVKKDSANTHKINFNIYDIVLDIPYKERQEKLKSIFNG